LIRHGPADEADIHVVSKSRDETLWVVAYEPSDCPVTYVLYNATEKIVHPLFCSQPKLLGYDFAPMQIVSITARDGLPLVGYLTRQPRQAVTTRRTDERSPLVLLVHGGPWERDSFGFNPMVQWLANRGYAVLQVNYRGSSGYGKAFLHKGDGEWGVGSMQHDLTDSVKWCIDKGIADEENICIFGASYGGYACLCGLAFTPELFKCGVDIAGVSSRQLCKHFFHM
jgi:dipeptidyl aminopeptidase/acylaminoacyl peptidase